MQNKKLIILVALGLIALFGLAHAAVTPSPKRRTKRSEYIAWGRNPFTAEEVSVYTLPGLILRGIVWDGEVPRAIINDDIVEVGDRVGESTVIDIKRDRVILNDGVSDFELGLWQ